VLLETLNWIHERQRHDIAVDLKNRLATSAGFEVVHCAQKDFHRAVEFFESYGSLSFGDATIAAYMQRTGIEYLYSFDDDCDGIEGIIRLDTPNNPVN
jgi:hypothetical protein